MRMRFSILFLLLSRLCYDGQGFLVPSTKRMFARQHIVLDLFGKASPKKDTPKKSSLNTTVEVAGIGGENGVVYDVNKVKRNLVQETLRDYKRELWQLLSTPKSSQKEVEDKLAALLQVNPVSTTTDSNLLDGIWLYAFGSTSTTSNLLSPSRFSIEKKNAPEMIPHASQNPLGCVSRQFVLEDEDVEPHMMERVRYVGGLFTKSRKFNVENLSRTQIVVSLTSRQISTVGTPVFNRTYPAETREAQALRILYLDPDLCVSTSPESDCPVNVYTKNLNWVQPSERVKRKVRFSLARFLHAKDKIAHVVASREGLWSILLPARFHKKKLNLTSDKIYVEHQAEEAKLTVVKLGEVDLDSNQDAWEGETDPFVHLSPEERQDQIKSLTFKQITQAKRAQERRARKGRNKIFERIQPFKKTKL